MVGSEWGRVRTLRGTGSAPVKRVLPGQPAEVTGLKGLPQAGDELLAVGSEERAQRISRARTINAEARRHATLARLQAASSSSDGGSRCLSLIVKADVQGSAEALSNALAALSSEAVKVQVVHVGVGPVTHADVQLAVPLRARVLGFNVRPAPGVDAEAKQHGIDVRCQRVIYHLLDEVQTMALGAAPRVEHEVVTGTAEVLQVFALKGAR